MLKKATEVHEPACRQTGFTDLLLRNFFQPASRGDGKVFFSFRLRLFPAIFLSGKSGRQFLGSCFKKYVLAGPVGNRIGIQHFVIKRNQPGMRLKNNYLKKLANMKKLYLTLCSFCIKPFS